jgi:hypothetical protein
MYQDDYNKVEGLLPTPSYSDTLHSRYNQRVILIYQLEGYVTSHSQYRWISNIKLGLKEYLCVPFTYEDEFYITDTTELTATLYQIKELSKAFKAPLIIYPKIMYPSTKKEMYKHLCWYAKRLIHQKVFTKEVMTATALLMNSKLKDRYSNKDLHKKVLGAYMFINENKEKLPVKLDEVELKKAHAKGAEKTNKKQRANTEAKIFELLKDDVYFKPNGKVNKTLLADDLRMHRRTLDKYLKEY